MAPPADENNFKYLLYNLGGGLANILTAVIIIVIMILTGEYAFFGSQLRQGLFKLLG